MLDSWNRGLRAAALAFALAAPPAAAAHRTPHAPVIRSGPARPSAGTTARFRFTGARHLRCRLDRARARRCARSATYRALAEGRHVFSVWAVGRRGARAIYAWTIDLGRPPRPVLTEAPDELSADPTARFMFSDAERGVALKCRLDGGPLQPCTSPVAYAALADGAHRFAVVAQDAAGNASVAATHGWTVDTQAPAAPSIVAAPAPLTAATAARFELSAAEAGVRLSCRLDGQSASCDGADGLAEGEHAFAATAVDAAGNESAAATHRWMIDATAPAPPTITARPRDRAPRGDATFAFTDAEASASFVCRIDDAAAVPCASPYRLPGPLAAGAHGFAVYARDAAGNRSAATSATWTIVPALYRETVLATPGVLGYWRLGEAVWGPAADERGSLAGAYRSGVTLGVAGAILDDPDTAAAFDGFSGEALLPGPVLTVNATLEGWFEWRDGIAVLRDHTSGGGWILAFVPAGGTTVMSRAGGGATLNTGINVGALRDGWHHLVLTKAGSNLAFYLDGRFVKGTGGAGNTASIAPWHVMNNGAVADQYTAGRADDVAIYNRALDAAEVSEHYRLGRGDA
jgi:Concanavalin A-like lectin/glucanases superfamily